jgi:ATP-dependent Clp protease adaptor protein ClpS
MAKNPTKHDDDSNTGVLTRSKPKTKKPSLYKVLLLNDDYTPMEFVVFILEQFFGKNREDVYTFEVAETKVTQVMDAARQAGHPLQCTLEKE